MLSANTFLTTAVLLGGEMVVTGVSLLAIFRFRDRLGLGPLFLLLGANQMISVVLGSSVYFRVTPSIVVSPGSAVFFPTALVAVLLVYLREDIPKTRTLISSVVLINVGGVLLLWLTALQMKTLAFENILGIPVHLFTVNGRVFLVGTVVLLVDFILLIILFQFFERRAARIPRPVRIVGALVSILTLDSLLFTLGAFYPQSNMTDLFLGQIAGKGAAGILFGALVSVYLWLFEPDSYPREQRTEALDVLSILTYKERYEIVSQKLRQEREANLAKSRFLAHMSHELRTPLNAIIGFTGLLTTPGAVTETDKRLQYLARVHDNSRHLLQLINNILDLSKIEAGRLEPESRSVRLDEILEETAAQLRIQARQKGIALSVETDRELTIETDPTRLKQVLLNLISNAIKFTSEGSILVRAVSDSGRPARVDIVDTGIGIPTDLHETIFEAFSQADSGTARSFEGSGLGLTISRALCAELGYRLDVESIPGRGSTFSIVFH
jgi:signal transduction histidine kinase